MTLKVKDVAELLGTTEATIRVGLQEGRFPFGTAIKVKPNSKRYVYLFFPAKLEEYITGARNEEIQNTQEQHSRQNN